MRCQCGQRLQWRDLEETEASVCFGLCGCPECGTKFGVEAPPAAFAGWLDSVTWTDEARHVLDRLPPYLAPLVRTEVEEYVQSRGEKVVTAARITEAQRRGTVTWSAEAERRLERVPAAVRAMARMELERTALDREMPEVTVELMEEIKARYFGMGAAATG